MAKFTPSHAVRLTTFAEFERYVRAFDEGHLNLLMILGPPGVGKSRSQRNHDKLPSGSIPSEAGA